VCSQRQNVEKGQIQVYAQFWYLQKECRRALAISDEFGGQTQFLIGSRHRAVAFFLQVPKLLTDLDPTCIYMLILRTYTKFVWKQIPADMLKRC